jgi:Zn finger protein HypA/HybF involved in hydrogenase expression
MRNIKISHIASNHVDFTCWNCYTSFDLEVGDEVICPKCKNVPRGK